MLSAVTFNAANVINITKEKMYKGLLRRKDSLSETRLEIRRKIMDEIMANTEITVIDELIIPGGFFDPGRYLMILTFKPSWQMMPI